MIQTQLRIYRIHSLIDKISLTHYKHCAAIYRKVRSTCIPNYAPSFGVRHYAEKKESLPVETKERSEISTSVKETVKETTKTVSYLGVIILGLGVTGVMFFTVFKELFSSKSPNNVYTKAAERCCNDDRIKNALGEPIKAFGEETRRGRRRHTSYVIYEKDGVEHIRMKFYLKGLRESATVHLEMLEDENGNYMYRYLFVQLDFTRRVIVLEDNRSQQTMPLQPLTPDDSFGYSPTTLTS